MSVLVEGPSSPVLTRPTGSVLWLIAAVPVVAQLVGSAFNIWYNLIHIEPLLTPVQNAAFVRSIQIYNLAVYPVAVAVWLGVLRSVWQGFRVEPAASADERLARARRRAINLPWWVTGIAGVSWLLCIPVFLTVLEAAPGNLNPQVWIHLPVSLLIAMFISLTHAFFALELLSQRLLYPVLFAETSPADTPGAYPLSIRGRGLLWAISAGACPILSLLLLILAPRPGTGSNAGFALAVGGLGIAFGLFGAWMLARLIAEPVDQLRRASRAVAGGDFDVHLDLLRADEFGPLIDEFNHMVRELKEKQRLRDMFGRHVGRQAAEQILMRNPTLGGIEQNVTVLFADIRNFTARCAGCSPQQVIRFLNQFLTQMVHVVEECCGGMVNKFLGDGFMALFGAGDERSPHADAALDAGCRMLVSLEDLNRCLEKDGQPPLAMGIGIHTGRAVVGSIGSTERMEYTAIGDTVNVASRVESLTKVVGEPLLITAAARAALSSEPPMTPLPPQTVKGQPHPLTVFAPTCADAMTVRTLPRPADRL